MKKILYAVLFIFIFTSSLVYGADSYCKLELTPSTGTLYEDSELTIKMDTDYSFESSEKLIVDLYLTGDSKRSATKTMTVKDEQTFEFKDLIDFASNKGIDLTDKTFTLIVYLKNGETTRFGTKFNNYVLKIEEEKYCDISITPKKGTIDEDTEFQINVDTNCEFKSSERLVVDLYVAGDSKRSATKTLTIKESQNFEFKDLKEFAENKGISLDGESISLVAYIKDGEETKYGAKFGGYVVEEKETDDSSSNPSDEQNNVENTPSNPSDEQNGNVDNTSNNDKETLDEIEKGKVKIFSSEFSRKSNEADDTNKIQRAIDYIFENEGGILVIDEKLLINGTVNIVPTGHYPLEICSADAEAMRYLIPLEKDYKHDEFKYTIERTKPGVVFNVNYDGTSQVHQGAWSNFYFHNLHFKNGTLKSDKTFSVTNMTGFYQMKSSGTYENISFYGFSKGIYQPSLDAFGESNYCDFNNFRNIYFDLLIEDGITVYNNDCGKFENIIATNCYKTVKNVLRIIKSPGVSVDNVFFGTWSTYNNEVSSSNERAIIYSNLSELSITNVCAEHAYLTPIYALNSTINCSIIRTKYQVDNFFKNIGSNLNIQNIKATAFERISDLDYSIDNSLKGRTVIDNWDIIDKKENTVEMIHPKSSMPNQIYRETIIKVAINNGKIGITDIYGSDCSSLFKQNNKVGAEIDKDGRISFSNLSNGNTVKAVFLEEIIQNNNYNVELYSLNNLVIQLSNNLGEKLSANEVNDAVFFMRVIY